MYQKPTEVQAMLIGVVHKSGKAKATGKDYSFWETQWELKDGTQLKIAANDAKWTGMIGGPHLINYTTKVNGAYTNHSMVEKPIYQAKQPPETKKAIEADNRLNQIIEHLDIIEQKITDLTDLLTEENAEEIKKNPF